LFQTIKNAIKTPEIRKKLLYTLVLIVIFRFGCYITAPGVNGTELASQMKAATSASFTSLIDTISGGAFSKLSIFAMSISPYITASIVIQLLGMIIPSLQKMIKEGGEVSKQKVNKYTKLLTLVLALVEALGIYISYSKSYKNIFINPGFFTGLLVVVSLMAGTAVLMWLGEQITNKGIGNGISMIIFVGIISGFPSMVTMIYGLIMPSSGFSTSGLAKAIALLVGAIVLIAAVVWVQSAERRIPVQYAKKVVGRKMYGGQNTHIPLKLAMAGVMPIIFASSFLTFHPAEVSNNIKKNGGFIPGIRAGKPTTDYLTSVLMKLTWFGSIFLGIIAILPMLLRFSGLNISFGGTSILIIVGVALETVQQLESQLVMRHYKGFLEK